MTVVKRENEMSRRAYALQSRFEHTELRTGEVIGLTWDVIDWEKRALTINKTLKYRHKQGHWRAGHFGS